MTKPPCACALKKFEVQLHRCEGNDIQERAAETALELTVGSVGTKPTVQAGTL